MSKTILLVSDDARDISLYSAALRAAGYHPITTLIGTDRVLHPGEEPALIVLDCVPKSGITLRELVLLLKEVYPGIPLVLYCLAEDISGETKRMVDRFLTTREPGELIATVKSMTRRAPSF